MIHLQKDNSAYIFKKLFMSWENTIIRMVYIWGHLQKKHCEFWFILIIILTLDKISNGTFF